MSPVSDAEAATVKVTRPMVTWVGRTAARNLAVAVSQHSSTANANKPNRNCKVTDTTHKRLEYFLYVIPVVYTDKP